MKEFFDSSVLIAAMSSAETPHAECLQVLEQTEDGFAAAHSLAECFCQLSGGRGPIRLDPGISAEAVRFTVFEGLTMVDLTATDYMEAIEDSKRAGVRGGGIYDFLLLAAARKCGANRIYTLNERHFQAFAPDLAEIIVRPGQ